MDSNQLGEVTISGDASGESVDSRLTAKTIEKVTNEWGRPCGNVYGAPTDSAIVKAQASIDRWLADSSCEVNGPEIGIEIDRLAATLEVLGKLNVGSLADEGLHADTPFTLGRFEIIGERGRGGFGIVLRAFDPLLRREVALKLPHPERLIAGQSPDGFVREAQVAARLQHPGIVRVYEARRLGPVWYIASAYCEGPTLAEWLDERDLPLPPKLASELLAAVADAVHYAHSRGVLHLDLKPENILLDATSENGVPQPIVTDFGLAGRSDVPDESMKCRIAGTLGYMAPEQRAGDTGRIGVAADIYALGAVLRELLQRPDSTCKRRPDLSPLRLSCAPRDLLSICQKCLEADPDKRYGTAHELAEELRRYIRGECVRARPLAWPGRILRWYHRRPAIAALVTLLALTLVVSMVVMTGLWHRAEGDLARFRTERILRRQVSDRMQETLLNFAWLTQEGSLQRLDEYAKETPATEALQSFLRDVRQWSTSDEVKEPFDESLLAALHSLALVQGVESDNAVTIEREFRQGLVSWAAVIKLQPERPQWRRAMALHLLMYLARSPEPKWLIWRSPEYSLGHESLEQLEEPYAVLLIEFARLELGYRLGGRSYEMLKAAIVLLEGRENLPDETGIRGRTLLIAYTLLARAAEQMSHATESFANVQKASQLADASPPPEKCDPLLASAVADALKSQARLLTHQHDTDKSLQVLERAVVYRSRALECSPEDARLRLDLAALHRGRANAFLRKSDYVDASAAFDQAIATIDAGLARVPNHRHLRLHRALMAASQAQAWLAAKNPERARPALESAVQDFGTIRLCQRDGRASLLTCVRCEQSLGKLYSSHCRFAESLAVYESSLARLAGLKPRTPRDPQHAEYTKLSEQGVAHARAQLKESARSADI